MPIQTDPISHLGRSFFVTVLGMCPAKHGLRTVQCRYSLLSKVKVGRPVSQCFVVLGEQWLFSECFRKAPAILVTRTLFSECNHCSRSVETRTAKAALLFTYRLQQQQQPQQPTAAHENVNTSVCSVCLLTSEQRKSAHRNGGTASRTDQLVTCSVYFANNGWIEYNLTRGVLWQKNWS